MAPSPVHHAEKGARGRYFIETESGEAELTYSLADGNRMVIGHTYVPVEARGREVALRLVERAVADAKARGLRIAPECAYVARVFERRKDLAALRA